VTRRDGITTDVVRALDAAGVRVTSVTLHRPSLDDVFFSLTGQGTAAGAGEDREPDHPGDLVGATALEGGAGR
jgi:hypothetical protein